MKVWVVNGFGQREKLINKLGKEEQPDVIIIMGKFLFSHALIGLQKLAISGKMTLETKLKEIGDTGKMRLKSSLDLEAILWVNILSVLNKRGITVFIIKDNFEFFWKQDGIKSYFNFEKGLQKYLGKKSSVCGTVRLPLGIKVIRRINVYECLGETLVFWPVRVPYQDDLYHFEGENTILITDGYIDDLKSSEKARPKKVISPFTSTKFPTIVAPNGITVINL